MTEPFIQENESYFIISEWKKWNKQVLAGFTTRLDGHSASHFQSLNLGLHVEDDWNNVINNRRAVANKLDVPLEHWVFSEQIHDSEVAFVNLNHRGSGTKNLSSAIRKTDALVTKSKNVLCAQLYADCVPLFFFEPQLNIIGIAHSGWKGTVKNIASEVIHEFVKHGAQKEKIKAVIGPCIQKQHYEVSEDVIREIPEEFVHQVTEKLENNRYLFELSKLNELYLLKAGLRPENIKRSSYCTYEEQHLFFSHRRDSGQTGRMMGFIVLKNDTNT